MDAVSVTRNCVPGLVLYSFRETRTQQYKQNKQIRDAGLTAQGWGEISKLFDKCARHLGRAHFTVLNKIHETAYRNYFSTNAFLFYIERV